MTSINNKSRLDWIDLARGVAIIFVVVGHTWRGLNGSGLIQQSTFQAIDSRIYAFHMPVFFVISGLFFVQTLLTTTGHTFVKKRLQKLLWPMILWAYIFVVLRIAAGAYANSEATLQDLIFIPIPGFLHLWFLWALLLINLALLPLKVCERDGKIPYPVLLGVAAVALAIQFVSVPKEITYWLGTTIEYLPYFLLGIILQQVRFVDDITPFAAIGAFLFFVFTLCFWPSVSGFAGLIVLKLALSVSFLMVCYGILTNLNLTTKHWIIVLGTSSMAIYLSHTIFSAAVRSVLLAVEIESLWSHLVLGIAAGLLLPLGLVALARRTKTQRLMGI